MKIPAYYGFWHHLGNWLLKASSWLVLLFLILPILVIVPLSFNAEPFFSFTEGMLTLDPEAYSLRWYREIFNDPKWILAIKNSFFIGILSTILATILGTSSDHIDRFHLCGDATGRGQGMQQSIVRPGDW